MNKNILAVIVIVGLLFLLGIGFGLGLKLCQKEMEEAKIRTPLAELLESEVIGRINTVASGEITGISGRNLTLSSERDVLTVLIKEEASINRLPPPAEETEGPQPVVQEEIEFGEIKVGDQVSIGCELKADGSLEGVEVVVLPQG